MDLRSHPGHPKRSVLIKFRQQRLRLQRSWILSLIGIAACSLSYPAQGSLIESVRSLAGKGGIVYVVDEKDRAIIDISKDKNFVPASTIKVLTCHVALEKLGDEFRFPTTFSLDRRTLVVRGEGDPMLISEELDEAAERLTEELGGRELKGIRIDNSYFQPRLAVPGVGSSANPYDAVNAATSINFNTIDLVKEKGKVWSAEEQTPLTPLARELARKLQKKGRQRLPLHNLPDSARYAAELIAAALRERGIVVGTQISQGSSKNTEVIYRHQNSRSLTEVCRSLLQYSNNFIANQLFLAIGAQLEGAPASLEKSRRVFTDFLSSHPRLKGIEILEGSGIAYENRVNAAAMTALLRIFESHHHLLHLDHGSRHKTGTLRAVATLVGYIETKSHGRVRYVIALDGSGQQRRWQIVALLKDQL